MKQELWGQVRTVVIYRSGELYEGQGRGVEKDLLKRTRQLQAHNERVTKPRARKRTKREFEREIERIVKGPLLTGLLRWQIVKRNGHWQVDYEENTPAIEHLKQKLGLRLLMTDRHEWGNEEIIGAYQSQAKVEYGFRNLKNPYHIGLRPQYHWTEQKVRVHVLTCVLGLLLVSMLHREVRAGGYGATNYDNLLDKLNGIRLAAVGEKGRGKSIGVSYQLEEMAAEEKRLLRILGVAELHQNRPQLSGVGVYAVP